METHATSETPGERRYAAATLEKVVALAGQLQNEQPTTLTAKEIEAIGVEVGLEPQFIARALAQIHAPSPLTAPPVRPDLPRPKRASERRAAKRAVLLSFPTSLLVFGLMLSSPGQGFLVAMLLCAILGGDRGSRRAGWRAGVAMSLFLLALTCIFSNGSLPLDRLYGSVDGFNNINYAKPVLLTLLGYIPILGGAGVLGAALRQKFAPVESTVEQVDTATSHNAQGVTRAELLEALFTLQNQLQSQKKHGAFLSVDVVRSSELKQNAPDLAVEHTFGRFRLWVESIVHANGGEMQSAAGDGTMCLFAEDACALRAARQIQEQIATFNRHQNHLSAPLAVRCGVSAGEVAWEAGKPIGHLQSRVIDRAAALQKQAQPGGVVFGAELVASAQSELGAFETTADSSRNEPSENEIIFTWQTAPSRQTWAATAPEMQQTRATK